MVRSLRSFHPGGLKVYVFLSAVAQRTRLKVSGVQPQDSGVQPQEGSLRGTETSRPRRKSRVCPSSCSERERRDKRKNAAFIVTLTVFSLAALLNEPFARYSCSGTQNYLDRRKIRPYHRHDMKTQLIIASITAMALTSCWHDHHHNQPPPPRQTNYYVAPMKAHQPKPKPKPKKKHWKHDDPRYHR